MLRGGLRCGESCLGEGSTADPSAALGMTNQEWRIQRGFVAGKQTLGGPWEEEKDFPHLPAKNAARYGAPTYLVG
jgi:hypothetical protein